MAADLDLRVRLEGGAEKLEVAQVRYRALNVILGSLSWRERLADSGALVAAVCADHEEVLGVLKQAKRLLEQERSRKLEKLVARVFELIDRAEALANERAHAPGAFPATLRQLSDDVAPTPKVDAEKWRAARSALPVSDPLLLRIVGLTHAVNDFATRPKPERTPLPWRREELPALTEALSELDAVCATLWRRLPPDVEAVLLQTVARERELSDDGPARLVRAERPRRTLRRRIDEALGVLFAPLSHSPHEAMALLRWLASEDETPRLQPVERARLFALAARLSEGPARTAAQWSRLERLAEGAAADGADSKALLDNLVLFLRIKQQKRGVRRANPKTLSEALRLLRELSS